MSQLGYAQRLEPALRDLLDARGLMHRSRDIVMNSLLSSARLKAIIRVLDKMKGAKGETAEIGCAAGGTSLLIAAICSPRRHWACDTFVGLVDADEHDDLRNGAFSSLEVNRSTVGKRLSSQKNISVVPGFFPDSAPAEMREARYSFVHIDVDTYRSIHSCFDFFSQRMLRGGVIALDDVIGRGTKGAKLAWSEIISKKNGQPWQVIEEHDPQMMVQWTA